MYFGRLQSWVSITHKSAVFEIETIPPDAIMNLAPLFLVRAFLIVQNADFLVQIQLRYIT
jgi:hypothetical protein